MITKKNDVITNPRRRNEHFDLEYGSSSLLNVEISHLRKTAHIASIKDNECIEKQYGKSSNLKF